MPEDQIPEMLCLRTFSLSPPADVLGYSGTALLYWNTLVLLYCTGIVYREGGCGAVVCVGWKHYSVKISMSLTVI